MTDIQEICRQLKPIIGDKADRYWLTYLTEDQDGKRDVDTAIRLLAVRQLGAAVDDVDFCRVFRKYKRIFCS